PGTCLAKDRSWCCPAEDNANVTERACGDTNVNGATGKHPENNLVGRYMAGRISLSFSLFSLAFYREAGIFTNVHYSRLAVLPVRRPKSHPQPGERIMADQAFERELKNTLQQIEKQFGKGAIMQLGEHTTADEPGISTGALSLDIALGGRGLPRGRVIEIFGPESSGKTTVALHAVA